MSTQENELSVEPRSRDHYLRDRARIPVNGYPGWLDALRRQGEAAFLEAELPHTHMEEWRQTNIAPIVNTPYASLVAPRNHALNPAAVAPFLYGEGAWTELVFVDGYFSPELSVHAPLPEGAAAGSLEKAFSGPLADTVQQHLGSCLTKHGAFTALNTAFIQDGAFLHVPKGVVLEKPIHCLFLTTRREAATAVHPRNLMVLEANAEAAVLVSHIALGAAIDTLDNMVEEIVVGENAKLVRYEVIGEAGYPGRRLCTTAVRQQRDSRFASFSLTLDGGIVRNQMQVLLAEEGGEAELNGLYLNQGAGLVNNDLQVAHAVPRCTSRITYKGVLSGESRSVFTGKVYVAPNAQQTDSMQINNNLLLSEDARIDTKPQLEIYADDVKCTHGTTVGAPPGEMIFYFRSRGVDAKTAQGMLTYGFADELVARIPDNTVRRRLERAMYKRFSPQHHG